MVLTNRIPCKLTVTSVWHYTSFRFLAPKTAPLMGHEIKKWVKLPFRCRTWGFTLRGRTKVDGQWKLYALVHNIEKWANSKKAA